MMSQQLLPEFKYLPEPIKVQKVTLLEHPPAFYMNSAAHANFHENIISVIYWPADVVE